MSVNGNGTSIAIAEWARERGAEFRSKDVSEHFGLDVRAVGPILRGLVNSGEIAKRKKQGKNVYVTTYTAPLNVADLSDPEFMINLKQSLADRLAVLTEELAVLDARRDEIEAEGFKIRSAYKILNEAA